MPYYTRTDNQGRVVERRPATPAELIEAKRLAAEAKVNAQARLAEMIAAHSRARAGEEERRGR